MNKKIIYVSKGNIPSKAANSIQVVNMSKAFSKNLDNFELLIASPVFVRKELNFDFKKWYGLKETSFIKKIYSTLFAKYPFKPNFVPFFYKFFVPIYLYLNKNNSYVFTREIKIAQWASKFKIPFIIEIHAKIDIKNLPELAKLESFKGLVVISEELKRHFSKDIDPNKIHILEDGIDVEEYDKISKYEARKELGINMKGYKYLATFTGHLYKDRGIEEIFSIADLHKDILFLFVGGWESDVKQRVKEASTLNLSNVQFIGFKPYSLMPGYQKSADILLLPYSSKLNTADVCSPLKLFEYMATKNPIITSKLKNIESVLEEDGFLIETDNSNDLSDKLFTIKDDYSTAQKLANNAYTKVLNYSWDKRVKSILEIYGIK